MLLFQDWWLIIQNYLKAEVVEIYLSGYTKYVFKNIVYSARVVMPSECGFNSFARGSCGRNFKCIIPEHVLRIKFTEYF